MSSAEVQKVGAETPSRNLDDSLCDDCHEYYCLPESKGKCSQCYAQNVNPEEWNANFRAACEKAKELREFKEHVETGVFELFRLYCEEVRVPFKVILDDAEFDRVSKALHGLEADEVKAHLRGLRFRETGFPALALTATQGIRLLTKCIKTSQMPGTDYQYGHAIMPYIVDRWRAVALVNASLELKPVRSSILCYHLDFGELTTPASYPRLLGLWMAFVYHN